MTSIYIKPSPITYNRKNSINKNPLQFTQSLKTHKISSKRPIFDKTPNFRKNPVRITQFLKTQKIEQNRNFTTQNPIFSHNIDDWVNESVSEIVQNLRKAPLLVQIIGKEKKVEIGGEKKWDNLVEKWRKGEILAPDGVIYVEEIFNGDFGGEEGESKFWGVLVQGKGKCGPNCYIMKTCRVMGCTHFCLTRVVDFRESVFDQLNSCWLLN